MWILLFSDNVLEKGNQKNLKLLIKDFPPGLFHDGTFPEVTIFHPSYARLDEDDFWKAARLYVSISEWVEFSCWTKNIAQNSKVWPPVKDSGLLVTCEICQNLCFTWLVCMELLEAGSFT